MNAEQIRKRANFFRRSAPEMAELLDACADVVEAALDSKVYAKHATGALVDALAKLEAIVP